MKTIGIIGAGEVGSQLARAAVLLGYRVVIANSRGPATLQKLITELGPLAKADWPEGAARAGDMVIIAVPLTLRNTMPTTALAGKVVLDTNNYMAWRDGVFEEVQSGQKTIHEMRQEQLPRSYVVKAFSHIQALNLFHLAKPDDTGQRHALSLSANSPQAAALAARFYREIGFDVVDNSPLNQSWRSAPGQPAWKASFVRQNASTLKNNLARARR